MATVHISRHLASRHSRRANADAMSLLSTQQTPIRTTISASAIHGVEVYGSQQPNHAIEVHAEREIYHMCVSALYQRSDRVARTACD
jgi:hypothetical protein